MPVVILPWLEYRWSFDFPLGMFAPIRERLRGSPARLEELLAGVSPQLLTRRVPPGWSAQGHAGHLIAVERLWQKRLHEYLEGATTLTAADMSNRATEEARFDEQPITEILPSFRAARVATVEILDSLTLEQAALAAHHPRLDRPMRLVDLCYFAAEHDDHHLAEIHSRLV
jgi:uncharacterized damage-inducible protein DinB